MTKDRSREEWRQLVEEYLESGEAPRRWARDRGINPEMFYYRVSEGLKKEPGLFVKTDRFCPCPLMKVLLCHQDLRIRAYLKKLCFVILGEGVAEAWSPRQKSVVSYASNRLRLSVSAKDINREFLLTFESKNGDVSLDAWTKNALLAAVESGVHDDDPLFEWAAVNVPSIRSVCGPNMRELLNAIQENRFERLRFVDHLGKNDSKSLSVLRFDTDDEFCAGVLDGFIASRKGRFRARDNLFFKHFAESLGFTPNSFEDFSPDTFVRQVKWFRDKFPDKNAAPVRLTRLFYVYILTLMPANQQAFTFATKLPPKALGYAWIVDRWLEGYGAVVYEPLDPAPTFSKWLLYPSENEARKATARLDSPRSIDFSLSDTELERLLIDWM